MKNVFKKLENKSEAYLNPRHLRRNCYLCSHRFQASTVFDRYCADCKEHNELLKFSESYPSVDESIAEKIYA
jgi:hypothetical protein